MSGIVPGSQSAQPFSTAEQIKELTKARQDIANAVSKGVGYATNIVGRSLLPKAQAEYLSGANDPNDDALIQLARLFKYIMDDHTGTQVYLKHEEAAGEAPTSKIKAQEY